MNAKIIGCEVIVTVQKPSANPVKEAKELVQQEMGVNAECPIVDEFVSKEEEKQVYVRIVLENKEVPHEQDR